ncbi:NfeD family protein [Romeria aff. gracilis LEGE 07310]|uniref:NfeD family protein n=1 Tax=Vasconcelosia minhoensis LEGE 07310 TaxID=915328 RepID=A0A8J7ATL5_9CYAN|nr:NfeD family protein [Romeria gracilis]MBE9076308.1 NfeD family protein [Romeria aff. gracilis LEGE 07310]
MLTLYGFCSIVGGIFVALAAFGGIDGADIVDVDVDLDADADTELETDFEFRDRASSARRRSPWQRRQSGLAWLDILLSFKFWTFGVCFFGLTGVALTLTQLELAAGTILAIALTMGLIMGLAVAAILRSLRQNHADSFTLAEDLVGVSAVVEVPFDAATRGKIRLYLKNSTLDMLALTHEGSFAAGDRVVVVEVRKNHAWVLSESQFHSEG